MTEIFEAVNAACDEQYFTIGIWITLQDAIDAVSVDDPTDLDDSITDDEGFAAVEIRKRKIGFGGPGKTVHRVTWEADFDSVVSKWTRKHEIKI